MYTAEELSLLQGLEVKRAALQRELSKVDRKIHQTAQAHARLEERIKMLEQRQRQAA